MSKDFIAKIREDSPRHEKWMRVMGTNEIPIKTPIPAQGSIAGQDNALFFMIDLNELAEEQKERLIQHISINFGVDEAEVRGSLDQVGCPILDEDVTIIILNPQKWI